MGFTAFALTLLALDYYLSYLEDKNEEQKLLNYFKKISQRRGWKSNSARIVGCGSGAIAVAFWLTTLYKFFY